MNITAGRRSRPSRGVVHVFSKGCGDEESVGTGRQSQSVVFFARVGVQKAWATLFRQFLFCFLFVCRAAHKPAPSSLRGVSPPWAGSRVTTPPVPERVLSPSTMAVATLHDVALVLRSVDGGDFLAHRCVRVACGGRASSHEAEGGPAKHRPRCATREKKNVSPPRPLAVSAEQRVQRPVHASSACRGNKENRGSPFHPPIPHAALASTAAQWPPRPPRRPPP